jgi:hypothetical protein
MLEVLGYQDLQRTVNEIGPESEDTHLKLNLDGRDPDDGMTQIAYEKGYFLLRKLEDKYGREAFDHFVKTYFTTHAFQSMTTERFLDYLDKNLLKGDKAMRQEVEKWVYYPGIPSDINVKTSKRFKAVDDAIDFWVKGGSLQDKDLHTEKWSTHEWLHFIRWLPEGMDLNIMTEVDDAFHFTDSGNAEILAAWFEHVIRHKYEKAYPQLKNFLLHVGRRKFVLPLYKQLAATPEGKEMARAIYKEARPNYHSVTSGSIDEVLK